MTAEIVPITRIRRGTTTWTYNIPSTISCTVGSLVTISFRGRPVLGIVWEIDQPNGASNLKLENVLSIIFSGPLLSNQHRLFIEWLAQYGFCSYSTALWQWLPEELHSTPLTNSTHALLNSFTLPQHKTLPQQAYLLPDQRSDTVTAIIQKGGKNFFGIIPFKEWLAIRSGELHSAIGREQALFAPWQNLEELTIFDPEDISYYRTQIPYVSLVSAARELSRIFSAKFRLRSSLPMNSLQTIWPGSLVSRPEPKGKIEIIDAQKSSFLSEELVNRIKEVLKNQQKCLILLNRFDRDIQIDRNNRQETVRMTGVESARKKLAAQLGFETLPDDILLDTRNLLKHKHASVGLTAVLAIESLEAQSVFANRLQGFSDIYKLLQYQCPCYIQIKNTGSFLFAALHNQKLSDEVLRQTITQQELHLPPFGNYIVCSYSSETEDPVIRETHAKISSATTLTVSHPFQSKIKNSQVWHIIISSSSESIIISSTLRSLLASLARPWKIQYNPWYLL